MTSFVDKPADLTHNGLFVAVKLGAPKEVPSAARPIDNLAEIAIGALLPRIQEGGATRLGLEPDGTGKITTATAYEAHKHRRRVIFRPGLPLTWMPLKCRT